MFMFEKLEFTMNYQPETHYGNNKQKKTTPHKKTYHHHTTTTSFRDTHTDQNYLATHIEFFTHF